MQKQSFCLVFSTITTIWIILMATSCTAQIPQPVGIVIEKEVSSASYEPAEADFLYVVHVQEKSKDVNIPDAQVSIKVEGKESLDGITDVDGIAEIFIDYSYTKLLGSLIVDAEGYKQHKIDVIVSDEGLPYDILLESASVSKTTGEPTSEPARSPNVIPIDTTTPIAPPSVPAKLVVTELGDNLRCRKSPGTSSKDDSDIVALLAKGIIITVIYGPVSQDGFTWWQVKLPDEKTCWVAAGDAEGNWIVPVATLSP